ncbi:MAG: hypothetical protein HYZ37_11990 [Candidatus Solibacter usitatus]|nr:hypothetical protein [Candidatus Solibacter usitatus]
MNVGGFFGPVTVNGNNYICKVVSKKEPDMSQFDLQKFDLLLRVKGRKAQERKELFEDGLVHYLKQKGTVRIHQETLKKLIDSFRRT